MLNFRDLRVGFVNLVSPVLAGKEEAIRHANEVKSYLRNEQNISMVDYEKPILQRSQAVEAWKKFKT